MFNFPSTFPPPKMILYKWRFTESHLKHKNFPALKIQQRRRKYFLYFSLFKNNKKGNFTSNFFLFLFPENFFFLSFLSLYSGIIMLAIAVSAAKKKFIFFVIKNFFLTADLKKKMEKYLIYISLKGMQSLSLKSYLIKLFIFLPVFFLF